MVRIFHQIGADIVVAVDIPDDPAAAVENTKIGLTISSPWKIYVRGSHDPQVQSFDPRSYKIFPGAGDATKAP